MTKSGADHLLFRSRQAPISMRLCAGLAGAKLAPLSRLGATSGATNSQGLLLLGFHGYIMRRCAAQSCSILTSEGNTDSIGGGARNQSLSAGRAVSVIAQTASS